MYQKHSETSREAYRGLKTGEKDSALIYAEVLKYGPAGICAPKVAELLDMVPGTVAARVITLERSGLILKLERTEKSPSGSRANVMVAAQFKDQLSPSDRILKPKAEDKKKPAAGTSKDREALVAARAILSDVSQWIALGAPIHPDAPLHKRIIDFLKN